MNRRLRRLDYSRRLPSPDDCPSPEVGAGGGEGDPLPPAEAVAPCRTCGHGHVVVFVAEVVEPRV
jgi:hypothetical protein